MNIGGVDREMLSVVIAAFVAGVVLTALILRSRMRTQANQRLVKTKDEFVALASHYLFTPISIIQGAVAQLEEQDSTLNSESRLKLYGDISKGEQRLWILAEQFLLVSQIEEGMLKLKIETGGLRDVVQGALASVDIFAREKGIKLELLDQTQAIQEARFDARRIKQATIALLDNAIKFSPEGARIEVAIIQEAETFAIRVSDEGVGMSDQAVATATQRFSRGTSSYTFDHEGIGLGLYTANAIIREHGGELRFESNKKRGTVVTLRFPNQ